MVLPTSGNIILSEIQAEFGGSNPASLSEYYGVADGVPTSGEISTSDFYGTTRFSTDIFMDNIADTDYRNWMETLSRFSNGKRTYTGTDAFNQTSASDTRYINPVTGTINWGATPELWSYAEGCTLIFVNVQNVAGAVTAKFNDADITLNLESSTGLTHNAVRFYSFSSSDPTYNLENADIYGSFSKSTTNTDNSQTVLAFPGSWSIIRSRSFSSETEPCEEGDVLIAVSAGANDAFETHPYTTANLTLRQGIRRSKWYNNHNLRMYTADSTGHFTMNTTVDYPGAYIQLRYVG